MAFIDFIIDIVRNGVTLQQKINVEPDATDATKIAPARVIQLNGKPLANNNAIPATVVSPSWATETTLANLSSRLPSALISGRLPVDGSGVTQPISGSVNIGNFPTTQPISGSVDIGNFPTTQAVSGTIGVSNAFALDATAIAIRDRLPTALGATIAGNSLPVTLATDGAFATAFGAATDSAAGTDGANTGFLSLFKRLLAKLPAALINGRFVVDGSGVTQPISGSVGVTNSFSLDVTSVAIRDRLPSALGASVSANSLPVTLSTDGIFATAFGTAADASASTDTASTGFISLFKRLFSKLPSALSNGRFLVDAVIKTSATNPSQYNAIGTSAGANIKNTGGSIYSISCINQNTSNRYLQLFNKSSAPSVTDIPIESHIVYGNGGELILGQDYFSLNGLDFATGISWGISTTSATYTAATASETIFTARYL